MPNSPVHVTANSNKCLRALRALLVSVALLSSAGGCSTAAYQKQTAAISEGFTAARDSFQSLSEEDKKSLIEDQLRKSLRQGQLLETSLGCRSPRDEKSKPTIDCIPRRYDQATRTSTPFVYTVAAPNGIKLSKLVATYGVTLSELAAAKDVIEVKEAAGNLTASISALAKGVNLALGGLPASSVLDVANWLFGLYLDVRRLEELKAAVERADPLIAKAADLLANEAVKLQYAVIDSKGAQLRELRSDINRLRAKGGDTEQVQKMAEGFVTQSLALQAYGNTDVRLPFAEMRSAHAELLESLQHPGKEPDAAFAAIDRFTARMKGLRDAFKVGSE